MNQLSETIVNRARQDIGALRVSLSRLMATLADPASPPKEPGASTRSETADRLETISTSLGQIDLTLGRLSAHLDQQSREREQLRGLFKVSQAINATLNLKELLNLVMDTLIQVMGAERGFLLLFNASGRELAAAVARNMDHASIEDTDYEISRSISAQVAREGRPILTTNAAKDPRFADKASVVHHRLRSIICVPLRVQKRVTGVIYVDNRFRSAVFSPQDRDLMAGFANQAAVCIENARLILDLQAKIAEIAAIRNRMANILDSIANGVVSVNTSGQIISINQAAAEILHVAPQAVMMEHYGAALPCLHCDALKSWIAQVQQDQVPMVNRELWVTRQDNVRLCLELSLTPLQDHDGELLGAAIVINDLSERKRLEVAREAEEQEKQRIRDIFSRYMAPQVVQRLLSDPTQIALGGHRQEVTILFADIRGFSPVSHRIQPETLVERLNQHLSLAAKAILDQEGILDKYQGDAVMAIFNAPLPQADHVLRAARAAIAMQRALATLEPHDDRLRFGVGLHVGQAVVGNIGTEQMMNYTVIGDAVNLAKRLQEHAAPDQILISQAVRERLGDQLPVRPLPALTLKGQSEPQAVYELLAL